MKFNKVSTGLFKFGTVFVDKLVQSFQHRLHSIVGYMIQKYWGNISSIFTRNWRRKVFWVWLVVNGSYKWQLHVLEGLKNILHWFCLVFLLFFLHILSCISIRFHLSCVWTESDIKQLTPSHFCLLKSTYPMYGRFYNNHLWLKIWKTLIYLNEFFLHHKIHFDMKLMIMEQEWI